MDVQGSPNMPSLWVFLIIVLAVLLGVVMTTSFIMHMVQRRQRRQLQRRIADGEVDLEALGIKRLNVPSEQIEKMPQYTFKSVGESSTDTDVSTKGKGGVRDSFFQPTCSICLDDFVFGETKVRELPCKHIFHPECIDPFLRENSSLCPLCKRSALPPGFCPVQVTNVMVRRERLTRRMRDGRRARTAQRRAPQSLPQHEPTTWERRVGRMRGSSTVPAPQPVVTRHGDEVVRHGDPTFIGRETDTELGPIQTNNSEIADTTEPPPEIARRGTQARRNWRRERLASQHAREYDEHANEAQLIDARRPLWRRMLGLA